MKSFEDSQIFTNEDTSKPENRVNLALFSLMQQNWFREWFLGKLDLPPVSILYPPTNERGLRPDLRVEAPDGSTTAWIEIELGTNVEQIEDYGERYDEPIKAVWGRRRDGGDLSLEEIQDFLRERIGSLPPQTEVNVRHLSKLINEGLDGHSRSGGQRTGVELSDQLRKHPLVDGLKNRLGDKLVFTTQKVGLGKIRADAMKEGWCSLWAQSPLPKRGMFFILNLSEASGKMQFPTKLYLVNSVPHHHAIEEYETLLNQIGLNIDNDKNSYNAGSLHADLVCPRMDDLAKCILALVDAD